MSNINRPNFLKKFQTSWNSHPWIFLSCLREQLREVSMINVLYLWNTLYSRWQCLFPLANLLNFCWHNFLTLRKLANLELNCNLINKDIRLSLALLWSTIHIKVIIFRPPINFCLWSIPVPASSFPFLPLLSIPSHYLVGTQLSILHLKTLSR